MNMTMKMCLISMGTYFEKLYGTILHPLEIYLHKNTSFHLIFWGVGHHGRLGFGHMGPAVGQLLEALVVLHGQRHAAHLALETGLVPYLLQAL